MAKYFNYFPKAFYGYSTDTNNVDYVTNIIARFNIPDELKSNASIYYEYDIRDGDTPETIAHKIYKSSERHWIVLAMNDIINPMYDWPLSYEMMISYINEKYKDNASIGQTGLQWARQNVKNYYRVEQQTVLSTGEKTIERFSIDSVEYAGTETTIEDITLLSGEIVQVKVYKESQTYFEYEELLNESKRKIKLMKPEIVQELEKEFKRVMAL